MIKRPLVVAAITAFVIAVIVVRAFGGAICDETKYTDGQKCEFECKVTEIEEKTSILYIHALSSDGKILLTLAKDEDAAGRIKIGSKINVSCAFRAWKEARNHGNFDEKSYYRSLGFNYKFKILTVNNISESYNILPEALRRLRVRLIDSIDRSGASNSSLLKAITVGYKSDMDEDTRNLFKVSGIAHIFAISGLHVSFVGMGIYRLLRKRTGAVPACVISSFLIICYGIMCGITTSTLRAVIMFIVKILGMELGRRVDVLSSAALAMVLILLEGPYYVTNSGFILSFAAIFAVAVIPDIITAFLVSENKKVFKEEESFFSMKSELLSIRNSFVTGGVISLSTLPVIISFNYEFPLFGVFVNTMVLWTLAYILSFSLSGSFVSFLSLFAGSFLINISSFLLSAIELICVLSSRIPHFNIVTGHESSGRVAVYYFFLVLFVILLNKAIKKFRIVKMKLPLRIILLLLGMFVLIALLAIRLPVNELQITFIDVDQGKCILIRSPNGNNYLIDSGSTTVDQVYKYRVEGALKYKGISEIDCVLLTHPDKDHISGLIEMIQADEWSVKIKRILSSQYPDNSNYELLIQECEKAGIQVTDLYQGTKIIDEDLSLMCIHPDKKDISDKNSNDMSAVIVLEYNGFKAVFTGDISSEEEKHLIDERLIKNVNLLDVAHHGSRFSTSSEFLEASSPEVAIISAGVHNMYGHPHKDTIGRLNEAGCEIYSTKVNGEIDVLVLKDGRYRVETLINQ